MKFEAITIKDIAKALGMSTSTVSRALRDSHEISETTKKKIREYANEFNYRPNPAALSLRKGKTKSIGIVVSKIANNYFSQVIDGVESVANDKGYNLIITQSKDSAERERMIINDLTSRSVDGLLISLAAFTIDYSFFKELKKKNVPLVFFDRIAADVETHKVTADNFSGAYEAVQHLVKNGYKKIALIANNKNLSITKERIAGCLKAFEEHHLELNGDWIQFCAAGGSDEQETERTVSLLLNMKKAPDAILTLSDKLSLETLRILKAKQVRIPEDIALMGFSNLNNTELLDPPLSVIYQPAYQMGELSARLLFDQIESKRPVTEYKNQVLSNKIITRKSSERVQR